jgi:Cdc6-like AAA superfamily ATPase
MDYLLTHNQGVMYNMLDWPMVPHSRLVLLGLANTMDLPERLHARISSRMGSFQERMIFKPYSIEQVDEILRARMAELNVFEPKSLQLLTRKAATIGGDLRAALKICQRSIEMHRDGLSPAALASSTVTPVPVQIVGKAAEEYRTTPLMKMTKSACTLYKVLFVSIITHNRAHGESRHISSDELYSRMLDAVSSLRAQTDFAMSIPPYSIFLDCIDRMVAEGFLVQETKREGRGVGAKAKRQPFHAIRMVKLRLDVSDVTNALRGECFEKLL